MSTLPRSPSKIVYPADGSLDHAEDAHKGVIATGVGSPLTTPDEAADESKGDQQPDSPTNDQSESPPSQSDEPLPTAEFTTEAEASIAREEQQATDGLAGNVTDLPPPPPTDPAAPTENPFEEILARAQESKLTATTAYQKADYATARQNYLISLELLQNIQGELSNQTKATLFEMTVANNNNVALCSLNMRAYADAVAFATNVIVLIGHLEMNIPDGQVWKYLVENGVTEDKLRKLWKKKAYYYLGKAEMKRKNYKEAIKALQSALALIADDAALTAQSDELRDLINVSKSCHAAENKKQKQTWTKAFEKRSKEPDAPADTPAATSSSSATPTKTVPFDPNDIKVDLGTKKNAGKGQGSSALSTWTWHSPFLYGLACVAALGTFSLVWYRSRR